MIDAPHYSAAGAKKKAVRLPDALFDGTVNTHTLHRAAVTYLANQRHGTHDTKTRAERKVLLLTAGQAQAHNVYLSGRNIPGVHVMRFADATAYEILWSDAVVVELPALAAADEQPEVIDA